MTHPAFHRLLGRLAGVELLSLDGVAKRHGKTQIVTVRTMLDILEDQE